MTVEDSHKTKEQLLRELDILRAQVAAFQQVVNSQSVQVPQTENGFLKNGLRQNENKYRQIVETVAEGIWKIDSEGKTTFVNPSIAQMLGYTVEEMLGRPFFDFMDEAVQRRAQQYLERRKQGIKELHDFRFRRKDGSDFWAIVSANPIMNEQGDFIGAIAVITDATERKQAELALQEKEERYRCLVKASSQILWRANSQGKFIEIQGWEEFTGQSEAEMLNGGKVDTIHPDDLEWITKAWWNAVKTKSPYHVEFRIRKYDGNYEYFCVHGIPVLDEKGEVREWVGMSTNINDRKLAEESLRQSEERLRLALDAGQAGVWDWDIVNNTVTWSERIYEFHGLTDESFSGGVEEFAQLIHPEDRERVSSAIQQAIVNKTPYQIEFRALHPSGAVRWLFTNGRVLYDDMDQPIRMLGATIDLTERKQAEAEREQLLQREQAARNRAEAASRLKDEFLAIVSHELRSPLNAILGWSRLLRMQKLDAQKAERALEAIERNAQAQTKLIEDLLDISRIIRGKVRLLLRPVNLTQVVEAALDTVRPTANNKQIQIESSLTPIVMVSGDLDRLQQVVWNLLSNAVKFTPEGKSVEVKLELVNSHAQIQVIDTGKGIKPEFLPYVFDRFRQENSATNRTQGGLGLGLSIVRNLVEMHGGTVDVTSAGEGQGAIFTVQLPLLKTEGDKINDKINQPSSFISNHSDFSLCGLRVLIVEDEPDTREFLVTALEQYEATVTSAASTSEALQLLQQYQFDVLLSDIGMPVEDGYTLIRKVRLLSPQEGGQIPAAALTAYAREEDRLQALSAGFQMHVPKPIDPVRLLNVVAKLAGTQTNKIEI